MRIRMNGKDEEVTAGNLLELISDTGLPTASLVVEHNGCIVRQDLWPNTSLADDDVLEFLSFVGGG